MFGLVPADSVKGGFFKVSAFRVGTGVVVEGVVDNLDGNIAGDETAAAAGGA